MPAWNNQFLAVFGVHYKDCMARMRAEQLRKEMSFADDAWKRWQDFMNRLGQRR